MRQVWLYPSKLTVVQPLKKSFFNYKTNVRNGLLDTENMGKSFFNYKINIRDGFLDTENMGKGTKIDFLSQIIRKVWSLARLAQMNILFFAYMTEKLPKGAGVKVVGLWSGTFLILVHMIRQLQVNINSLFHFGKCK